MDFGPPTWDFCIEGVGRYPEGCPIIIYSMSIFKALTTELKSLQNIFLPKHKNALLCCLDTRVHLESTPLIKVKHISCRALASLGAKFQKLGADRHCSKRCFFFKSAFHYRIDRGLFVHEIMLLAGIGLRVSFQRALAKRSDIFISHLY